MRFKNYVESRDLQEAEAFDMRNPPPPAQGTLWNQPSPAQGTLWQTASPAPGTLWNQAKPSVQQQVPTAQVDDTDVLARIERMKKELEELDAMMPEKFNNSLIKKRSADLVQALNSVLRGSGQGSKTHRFWHRSGFRMRNLLFPNYGDKHDMKVHDFRHMKRLMNQPVPYEEIDKGDDTELGSYFFRKLLNPYAQLDVMKRQFELWQKVGDQKQIRRWRHAMNDKEKGLSDVH